MEEIEKANCTLREQMLELNKVPMLRNIVKGIIWSSHRLENRNYFHKKLTEINLYPFEIPAPTEG